VPHPIPKLTPLGCLTTEPSGCSEALPARLPPERWNGSTGQRSWVQSFGSSLRPNSWCFTPVGDDGGFTCFNYWILHGLTWEKFTVNGGFMFINQPTSTTAPCGGVWKCVCVYLYIYFYTVYRDILVYLCKCIQYMYVRMYLRMCVCMCMCIYICVCMCVYVCMSVCLHVCMYACMQACMDEWMDVYVYVVCECVCV